MLDEASRRRWRAPEFSAYAVGRGRSVVWSREVLRPVESEQLLVWLLGLVQGVKSLEEHAGAIAAAGSSGDPAGLVGALEALEANGLLIVCPDRDGEPAAPTGPADSEITTIGIITADRPAALQRSIGSIAGQCRTFAHRPRLVVIDGSGHPAHATATRAVVDATAAASGLECEYVGAIEAKRLQDVLGVSDSDAFGLTPGPIGANRNLLLLMTAGENILSVDDDVLCETWTNGDVENWLRLVHNHLAFRDMAFFADRASAVATTTPSPIDLVAAHAALLGRSVQWIVGHSPAPVDLHDACGHLLTGLANGTSHAVKATFGGIVGDDGIHCPYRRLFGSRFVRGPLWSDRDVFARAMTSREVRRVARTTLVAHDANVVATWMGLANRTLLPPFMPAGRNEDGLFGVTLAACDTTTTFGHLPIGVVHDSHRPSTRVEPPMQSARETRVSELLVALVRRIQTSLVTTSPAARLVQIGERLTEAGRLDVRDLTDLVVRTTLETRSRDFEGADEAAEDPACPEYWRKALDGYRAEFLAHVTAPDFFVPIESRTGGAIDEDYLALGRYLRDFGQLMVRWPELWDAARTMNVARRNRTG